MQFASRVNKQAEDIGARRLHTIMEKVLDEISLNAPDLETKPQVMDAAYVQSTLGFGRATRTLFPARMIQFSAKYSF